MKLKDVIEDCESNLNNAHKCADDENHECTNDNAHKCANDKSYEAGVPCTFVNENSEKLEASISFKAFPKWFSALMQVMMNVPLSLLTGDIEFALNSQAACELLSKQIVDAKLDQMVPAEASHLAWSAMSNAALQTMLMTIQYNYGVSFSTAVDIAHASLDVLRSETKIKEEVAAVKAEASAAASSLKN